MKQFTHRTLSFCLLFFYVSQLIGQTTANNLNTIVKASSSLVVDPTDQVQIRNLKIVNTPGLDYSPVLLDRGMVFSSDRTIKKNWLDKILNNHNSNLFFSPISEDGQFYEPMPMPGKINSKRHEGSATFNADQNVMIYTRNCKHPNDRGYYELKLSSARLENGVWEEQTDLPFNDGFRTCHPALSKDGQLLIFSANRPNGLGGMDLYASEFINGEWTTPYNLGQEINSSGDEVFPYLDEAGHLYFASNGRPGMGGLDLFKSDKNSDGSWTMAIRFPEPFNSRWDDFSFVTDANLEKGFFTSNRPGGQGLDDIYTWKINKHFEIPAEESTEDFLTQISVMDESTGLPLQEAAFTLIQINPDLLQTGFLDEPVTIVNQLDQNVIALLGNIITPDDNSETARYPILKDESYLIVARHEGRSSYQQIVCGDQLLLNNDYAMVWPNPVAEDLVKINPEFIHSEIEKRSETGEGTSEAVIGAIALLEQPLETTTAPEEPTTEFIPGEEVFTARAIPANLIKESPATLDVVSLPKENRVISFPSIYHDYNSIDMIEEEAILIENIVQELNKNKGFHLLIKSHTDSRGSDIYNLKLSERRAISVMNKIIQKGISADRLSAKGMGESELMVDCKNDFSCTEADHKLNRRTEFVIKR